jgi:5'-nucleotidase
MAPENHHEDGKVYQVNRGIQAVYNNAERELESLTIEGRSVQDDALYTVCILEHHYKNSDVVLDVPNEALAALGKPQVVTTSARDVLEEYLGSHQNLSSQVEGRLLYT